MGQYANDWRGKLMHAWQQGEGRPQDLADGWGVSRSWLQKGLRRWRETGETAAARHRHGPVSPINPPRFTALLPAHRDATLAELGRRLRVSAPTVGRWVQQLGLARQKSRCGPANRPPARPGVAGGLAASTPPSRPAKARLRR